MANYTAINKSTSYFNTKLYTGNGSAGNAQTGVGFQPDWTWIKNRATTNSHSLFDAVRGVTKNLVTNSAAAESTNANGVTAFGTDGFTVGSDGDVNGNGNNMVAWNWKAGNSAGSSNSNGSVTSTVSANTTAGFSICKFNYPNSGNFTVGHGLGVAPDVVIVKGLAGTTNWQMYHSALGNTKNIQLNYAAASSSAANWWGSTSPTSTVFTVGADLVESGNMAGIAYCFAAKQGYSRFGKWIGNGNADGTFIYTGFAPKWLLLKKDGNDGWWLVDDKMANVLPNPNARMLVANTNAGDNSSVSPFIDIYSNGFKLRSNWSGINADGSDYIYLAIGQTIVGTNNIAAVGR